MNTIIGASLTTRTDGLGTARYSDPVSGQGGGGGFQGPQGLQGDQGPEGERGFQGPTGAGGVLDGTPPIVDSQDGTEGIENKALKFDTKPGLLLAGGPAVADTSAETVYPSLEFTQDGDPGPQMGLRARVAGPYLSEEGDFCPTIEVITRGAGHVDAKGGLQVKIADHGLRRTPDGLDLPVGAAGDVLYYDGNKWVVLHKDVGKFLESGPAAVSWGTPAGGTPGNTPPVIVDEVGAHPEGAPVLFMRNDTVGALKLVGSPGLFTETGGDTLPTLEAVTVGAVKQGFRVRLADLDYDYYSDMKAYGLLKAVGPAGPGVTKDGLAVLVDRGDTTGCIVAGANGVTVNLDTTTSGLKIVDKYLKVKLEAPGPGTGGLLLNASGELYTVWQADP